MQDDQTQPAPNTQPLMCKVCQKVNLADGSQVWVCKECGTEHQPDEVQAVVDQAAAAAPAAPVEPTDQGQPTQ